MAERKKVRYPKLSAASKKRWQNYSEPTRNEMAAKKSAAMKEYWASLTPEQQKEIVRKRIAAMMETFQRRRELRAIEEEEATLRRAEAIRQRRANEGIESFFEKEKAGTNGSGQFEGVQVR